MDVWEGAWDGRVQSEDVGPRDALADSLALPLEQTLGPDGVGGEAGREEYEARNYDSSLNGASVGPQDDHLEQMRDLSARDVS